MTSGTRLFEDSGVLAKAILQASDDVIFAKDLQGRYQYANPATVAAVGRPLEEVLGRCDAEILADPVAAQLLMDNDRKVLASGEVTELEETVPAPGGETRHWLTRKMPLRDGQGHLIGLLGIARDVTQRKMAEAQRDANHLKLQMGIQAAGLVMAEIDYRTNQNQISGELALLLELGDGAMTVPRQAIFDRIHPEDRERYLQAIAVAIDPAGNGHLAIDVRALLPSGGVRWLHIRLQVTFTMLEGRMQPDRGICAARDVTAERVAQQQLVEADRRKDEFIATLAHELRNPLAPIRTGLEILKRVGQLPSAAARTRDIMERQLNHMVRLVDDLLDVSRIGRGKLELRMAPLTLAQVVEHALEASQPAVEAAGHTLRVELPQQPVVLAGDLTRLAQVVSNLVNNAAKYTPAGGSITVAASVRQHEVAIEVSDTGAGIAPEVLPHVFGLFVQGDRANRTGQGGLGIGLWLVRRLVELHHGTIEARSGGPGQGSTFTVLLPAADGPC